MLRDEDKTAIQNRLNDLANPVELKLFTQKVMANCQYCEDTEKLMQEVAELSPNLSVKVLNFVNDKDDVEAYKIDKIPALVLEGEEDLGLRFYGIPAGYEFATFLDTLIRISKGEHELEADSLEKIASLTQPIHIQVFVTPTCPYCTRAAATAYQLAMANSHITADVVEVTEFPQLAQKYGVMGVPKVVINETHSFEGALPESAFVDEVLGTVY